MVVVVDDFIPCKTNKNNKAIPAFSSSRNREASVLILEKAWAKLNYKCFMKTWYVNSSHRGAAAQSVERPSKGPVHMVQIYVEGVEGENVHC